MGVTVHDIIREEVKRYNISLEYLRSDTRTKRLADIRQYIMWRARKETGRSFPFIGQLLNRDHTSVIHGYRKLEKLYQQGGILQIRPAPPTEDVGGTGVDVPLRSRTTSRRLFQLIYMDGKWSAGYAECRD